jgi:lipoprotein-releasing system ATP-binding protein
MTTAGMLLELANVCKRFQAPDGASALSILEGISLGINRGESVAIIGPSGSGKSTLLQIMGTLDQPSSGTVILQGKDITSLNEAGLAEVRNRRIGFVFQFHYLLPQCTVLENVLVPTLAGASSKAHQESEPPNREPATARAERLLRRVGLGDRFSHRPGQLSGGERQRVAVVRALINQPQLLLADEPTGALDQSSAQALAQLLIELNREEQVALVVVTHARDLAQRMGRVFELKQGHLVGC